MSYTILASALVALVFTYIATKYLIRYFKFIKLVTTDVHKRNAPLVPHSGGIPLMVGFIGGLLTYIFLNVFLFKNEMILADMFAAITSIFIIAFVGLLDDLNSTQTKVRGFIEGKRGLKRWQKPLLTLFAAFPLMAIMAGSSQVYLPLIGSVEFGIFYPLLFVPLAVVISSNAINMLGGFNGLEAGMGIVYTLSLGIFSLMIGNELATIIFLTAFAALLGFSRFNFTPAKILAGDSLTYVLGAIVAVGAIVGNMERAVLLTMIPFIIQAVLKFWSLKKIGRFASDLGVLERDGTISSKYGNKIYSWTHLIMRIGRFTEVQIVAIMMGIQVVFSILPFIGVF